MSNPILVSIYRGDVLESFHRGVFCLVDKDKRIVAEAGDIQQMCYPRSALKFFQQLPLITSGAFDAFGFTLEELAVMCGSHNGEADHVRVVDQILSKIGLDRSHLECGPQFPTHRPTANALIKAGLKPESIHNNCSGKHAGFLAQAVHGGHPTADYINPNHPIQQEIKKVSLDFHEATNTETALDGCSAPIFSFTVHQQAIAYMQLLVEAQKPSVLGEACAKVIQAITQYPFMVAGTGRYCTEMMEAYAPDIIGKTGAEGIFSFGFTQELIGGCIKVDDGKMMPQYYMAEAIFRKSGKLNNNGHASLDKYIESPIKNFNKLVTGKAVFNQSLLADNFLK